MAGHFAKIFKENGNNEPGATSTCSRENDQADIRRGSRPAYGLAEYRCGLSQFRRFCDQSGGAKARACALVPTKAAASGGHCFACPPFTTPDSPAFGRGDDDMTHY